jgi:hypothetical protein
MASSAGPGECPQTIEPPASVLACGAPALLCEPWAHRGLNRAFPTLRCQSEIAGGSAHSKLPAYGCMKANEKACVVPASSGKMPTLQLIPAGVGKML